nr:MAG TPA: hypothetical protein [Bacteriophage sp.]
MSYILLYITFPSPYRKRSLYYFDVLTLWGTLYLSIPVYICLFTIITSIITSINTPYRYHSGIIQVSFRYHQSL